MWEHHHCFQYLVASTTELNCDMLRPLCASNTRLNLKFVVIQLSQLSTMLLFSGWLCPLVLILHVGNGGAERVELRGCHACAWLRTQYKQA